jgi:beta-lactamase regulating signal transducer with metallopeptidase domain
MTALDLLVLAGTNALFATLLALAGWLLTRVWKHPYVASLVWLVVLLKLVTPPLVTLPFVVEARGGGREPSERRAAGLRPPVRTTVTTASPSSLIETSAEPRRPGEAQIPQTFENTFDEGRARQGVIDGSSVIEPLTGAGGSDVHAVRDRPGLDLASTLLCLWLAGTLVVSTVTLIRVIRFRRRLRRASSHDSAITATVARVASRLHLRRCPPVRVVEAHLGPLVWAGAVPPVVIVPRHLWNAIGDDGRETLLAHELAHIVRHDHAVRRLEAIVLALYWWLPTAWLAVRKRESAAEACCDALVLATYPERPQAYADALFQAVTLLSTGRPAVLTSGLGRTSELKERLTMILHNQVPNQPRRLARLAFAGAASIALAVSVRIVQAERATESNGAQEIPAPAVMPVSDMPPMSDSGESADPFGVGIGGEYETPIADSSSPFGYQVEPFAQVEGDLDSSAQPGNAEPENTDPDKAAPADPLRDKMLAALAQVIASPDEQADVKAQALLSYGRLARGRDKAKAEVLLLAVAEDTQDTTVKLAAANALHTLGSEKGVEIMWSLLEASQDENTQWMILRLLHQAKSAPPTVESVLNVAQLVRSTSGTALGTGLGVGPPNYAHELLNNLTTSGHGVDRLVEAIKTAKPSDAKGVDENTVRTVLLSVLRKAKPDADDVANALVTALSSKDAGVRGAAALAIGNVTETGGSRRGSRSTRR